MLAELGIGIVECEQDGPTREARLASPPGLPVRGPNTGEAAPRQPSDLPLERPWRDGQVGMNTPAPLTDAGLTPYHAIKRELWRLVPGSSAVVLGVGGLGHMAVQLLRELSPARVVAVDPRYFRTPTVTR